MKKFIYDNHTKLIYGEDAHLGITEIIKPYGKSVMLVHQKEITKMVGIYDDLCNEIKDAGMKLIEFTEVQPNPLLDYVEKGIMIGKEHHVDFILAVGGGSVMDAAKAISIGITYDGKINDFFGNKPIYHNVIPVGVISTIAATGSESSAGAVISDTETHQKYSLRHEKIRPVFAILNPKLTVGVPQYITNCGIVDMFSHTLERYFTQDENNIFTDELSIGLLKSTVKCGKMIQSNISNINLRGELLLISVLSQSGVIGLGRQADWATHFLAHEITSQNGLAHGATLSIMIPAWMKYVYKEGIKRFKQYSTEVWELKGENLSDHEIAWKGILQTEQFFKELGLPTKLGQVGIEEDKLNDMANNVFKLYSQIGVFKKLQPEDVVEIYKLAL